LKYELRILPSAEREIDKLSREVHDRISKKILTLEDNPRPVSVKKLSGREEYRLRIGDYRVLYTIDDKNGLAIILAVGHRKEVYR